MYHYLNESNVLECLWNASRCDIIFFYLCKSAIRCGLKSLDKVEFLYNSAMGKFRGNSSRLKYHKETGGTISLGYSFSV